MVDVLLLYLESGRDPAELLEAPAACGSPLSGIPVFGWLAKHFDVDIPEPVAAVSADVGKEGGPLSVQVRAQLKIVRDSQIVKLASTYVLTLDEISNQLIQRYDSGVGSRTNVHEVSAWLKDAQLEQRRAESRLLMSLDAHEDQFGDRTGAATDFPTGWESRQEPSLEATLEKLEGAQRMLARRYWRKLTMEKESLQLYQERIGELVALQKLYQDQFSLGQLTLGDVIGLARSIFDVEVQQVITKYHLHTTQVQLLALNSRLFAGDLLPVISQ